MALPATPIYWKSLLLWDPQTKDVVRNATVEFFLEGDGGFTTPQELFDYTGATLGTSLTSNDLGYTVPFVTAGTTALVVKAGEYVDHLESIQGVREDVEAARDAAIAAATAAGALAAAATGAGGIAGAPPTWPTAFPPSPHSHLLGDVLKFDGSPLAPVILALLAATDQQSARAAINAGTSSQNLTIGSQPGQVAAGDHAHSQYMTQAQVEALIAAGGGGGGSAFGSNIWAVRYASGAYPAVPAHVTYANGYRVLFVFGPVPYTLAPPTGMGLVYVQDQTAA